MHTSDLLRYLHNSGRPLDRARALTQYSGLLFREQFITEAQELMKELRKGEDHEAQAMLDQLQKMVNAYINRGRPL